MTTQDTTAMGAIIAALRREKQAKQEELASYVGVSAQAVSKWENGGLPDPELLPKIADFFGVSIDTLFGRDTASPERLFTTLSTALHTDAEGKTLHRLFDLCYLLHNALESGENEPEPPENGETLFYEITSDSETGENGMSKVHYAKDSSHYLLLLDNGNKRHLFEGADYASLFADLADESFFAALSFLTSRSSRAKFTSHLFVKQFGWSREQAAAVIEKLCRYKLLSHTAVEMDDEETTVYNLSFGPSFATLLTFAKELSAPSSNVTVVTNVNQTW